MVSDLAAFGHRLLGVEQDMSFFGQCSIFALFFRLIERTTANQQRHVDRGKVQFRFESGGIPGQDR